MDFWTPLQAAFVVVLGFFSLPNTAYQIGMVGVGLAILLVIVAGIHTAGGLASLQGRIGAIEKAFKAQPDNRTEAFSKSWGRIDAAFLKKSRFRKDRVVEAWEEFKETLVDPNESPMRNTARPQNYFDHAVRPPNWLDFAANLFVGAGLVCTFLGLAAALKVSVDALGAGGGENAIQMQESLTHLLTTASTKFVTSIVGVGLSLFLKLVDRACESWLRKRTEKLCELIESGVHYVPLQYLAARQLVELEEQSRQLKTLSTNIAVAVDSSFQKAMAPVVQGFNGLNDSLGHLNSTLLDSQSRQMEAIREGIQGGVSHFAGGELGQLAAVLTSLGRSLEAIDTTVKASGETASGQIAEAAAEFARVVADMRLAFEVMSQQMSASALAINQQAESQIGAIMSRIDDSLERLQSSSALHTSMVEATSRRMQAESASAIGEFGRAAQEAAQTFSQSASTTMKAVAESAGESLLKNLSEIDRVMGGATGRLGGILDATVVRMQAILSAFDRVSAGLKSNSESLDLSSVRSREASQSLGSAANAFGAAGVSAKGTLAALESISNELSNMLGGVREALDTAKTLHKSIVETQAQVSESWGSYSERFEAVDEQLGAAATRIAEIYRDAHERMKSNVIEMDGKLGQAVSQFSTLVGPLSEVVENLNDWAEAQRGHRIQKSAS